MESPILVEVLRGDVVESVHRGVIAVVDAEGNSVFERGDTTRAIFPRSAVKAIQALPFIESGAADAFGFGRREIALACASHSGEPEHAELARAMVAKAGLDESAYECGAHWPMEQKPALALAATGAKPNQFHNNCSGKHAGFLCTCAHKGISTEGYVTAGHEIQQMAAAALEEVTGARLEADQCGIDGCSIPTYAVPIRNLAQGFARLATGSGLSEKRFEAARRIFDACMSEPFYVAGTDRADTKMMQAGKGRIFTKTGAEGVFCAAIPELGLGIALKCDDGATRSAEVMIAQTLARLLPEGDDLRAELEVQARPELKNWRGIKVGALRPSSALTQ